MFTIDCYQSHRIVNFWGVKVNLKNPKDSPNNKTKTTQILCR